MDFLKKQETTTPISRELYARICADPVEYCRVILGENITPQHVLRGEAPYATAPWSMQRQIMRTIRDHQKVVVYAGHNVGKTHLAVRTACWFLQTRIGLVITTAPKLALVKDLFWRNFRDIWQTIGGGGELLTMECHPSDKYPKWAAIGFTAREAEGFAGYHEANMLFVVDEASGVDKTIIESIEGMLSNPGCKLLMIGNPLRTTGPFIEAKRDPSFKKFTISCYDHPNVKHGHQIYEKAVGPDWPDQKKRQWKTRQNLFRVRVLGEEPTDDPNKLIPASHVLELVER